MRNMDMMSKYKGQVKTSGVFWLFCCEILLLMDHFPAVFTLINDHFLFAFGQKMLIFQTCHNTTWDLTVDSKEVFYYTHILKQEDAEA